MREQIQLAVAHINSGDLAAAEVILGELQRVDENSVDVLFLQGIVRKQMGHLQDAAILLQRAVQLNPRIDSIHNELGEIYEKTGRPDEAAREFQTAIALNKDNTRAHFNLGNVCGQAVSFHRAEDIKMALVGRLTLCQPKDIQFSAYGEQTVLADLIARLPSINRFCVDIGASDGVTFSNSYPLFRDGWPGVAIEARREMVADLAYAHKDFPQRIDIIGTFALPDTIQSLLAALGVPKDLGFLSLDIDSFDYDVAAAVLETYRPSIICTEINERIPPPVKFAVRYPGNTSGAVIDMGIVGGVSLSMLAELLDRHDYGLIHLEYNNVFAIQRSSIPALGHHYRELSPEDAWREGFLNRPDRKLKSPWNEFYEPLFAMSPERVVEEYHKIIAAVGVPYTLTL
jgi:tetratricopeptide (TPR) repeat protein